MPLLEMLPVGPDTAQWSVWSTTVRVVVTDPDVLTAARRLVLDELAAVELAASRFREDSELSRLASHAGRAVPVSPLLAELVGAALLAAEWTGGDVDPTVGAAMSALGYDRDFELISPVGSGLRIAPRPAPGWRRVKLVGDLLTVPAGVELDLGATAKAWTADRCAKLVAAHRGGGVLVSLGGDIATAGPAPDGGWRIRVADQPGDPVSNIRLPAGGALATSSTASRQWQRGSARLHHIVDPRSGAPARPVWRTVSAAAGRCVDANTITTAALVRGLDATPWLRELGVPIRLVTAGGKVVRLGGWPADDPANHPAESEVAS